MCVYAESEVTSAVIVDRSRMGNLSIYKVRKKAAGANHSRVIFTRQVPLLVGQRIGVGRHLHCLPWNISTQQASQLAVLTVEGTFGDVQ